MSISTLIDRVWAGSPPDGARNVVYTYIARLRRILAAAAPDGAEAVRLIRDSSGYRLDVTPEQIDLHRFRYLLVRARAMAPDNPQRCGVLSEALRLWKGEPLAGLDNGWAARLRYSLQKMKNDALAEWADAELQGGRSSTVIAELRYALSQEPLAELLHEQLIRALHRSGQQAEALSQYERARRIIADELGSEPGPALRELHRQMLTGTVPEPAGERSPAADSAAPRRTVPEQSPHPPEPPEPSASPEPVVREPAVAPGPNLLPRNVVRLSPGRRSCADAIQRVFTERPSRPAVIVLSGGAGVGKSALAINAAHQLGAHCPDGQLWLCLHGSTGRPLTPATALSRLLRALGTAAGHYDDLDELTQLYQSRIQRARVLLVLDDAADERQLLPLLPDAPGCGVLVTTRHPSIRPIGAHVLPVRALRPEDGLQLLGDLLGEERVRADPEAARELVALCEGLPLALRAVANRLLARPHWSLRRMAECAADEERRLDTLSYGSLDVSESLTSVYRQLAPEAAALFRHLGAQPATDFIAVDQFTPEISPQEAEELLEKLVDANLLEVVDVRCHGGVRYRIRGLRRLFARRLARQEIPSGLSAAH